MKCIDTEDSWSDGQLNLYSEGKSKPLHLTVTSTDYQVVLVDHKKYQWLSESQLRVMLQSLVLEVRKGSQQWSRIRKSLYKSLCEAWRRYADKRRIQYKRREQKSQPKRVHTEEQAHPIFVGDRPKRGARLAAEERLAEILPGEAGPSVVAPPPGLDLEYDFGAELSELPPALQLRGLKRNL